MRISTNEFLLGSLNNILAQESTVNQLNQQISSGQSMSTATDDPAGAGLALGISNQVDQLTFDAANAQSGAQSLQGGLGVLQQVTDLINQVSTTADQAATGTMSASDRQSLVGVVQSALQELIQFGNAQSANGEYMFGGSQTGTPPFLAQPNGQVTFVGDNGTNSIAIAPSLSVPVNASGQGIFMNIPNGNGTFSVAASGSNTGTAYAIPSGVTSASQVAAEHLAGTQFEISFGTVQPNGDTAYTVTSGTGAPGSPGFIATSGVIASGSAAPNSDITFGGMDVSLSGAPAAGDKFAVATSQNTNIFQIFQNLVTALQAPHQGAGATAIAQQQIEGVLSELSSANTSVLSAQATLGTNLSEIQAVQTQDGSAQTTAEAQLSNLQSINLPQVMTNYNESIVSLQAAQSAFARIQNLSLFAVIGP
jgi:flagellar hook-associated protein 3 FlgL